jgi:hypothetical protein
LAPKFFDKPRIVMPAITLTLLKRYPVEVVC